MPTYEYECKTCGSVFDVFQSITAAPLKKAKCEECGSDRPVKRLIGTGGGVIFKGSGFYQTDYRSEGYKKAESADKPSSGKSEGGDAKKGGEKAATTEKAPSDTKSTSESAATTKASGDTLKKSAESKPVKSKSAAKRKSRR